MRKSKVHSLSLRIEKLLLNGWKLLFFFFISYYHSFGFLFQFPSFFFHSLSAFVVLSLPTPVSHFRIKMSGDGPYGPVVNGTQIIFFEYLPNKPAAISFVALFGMTTLAHLILLIMYRAWFFIPFILGGICKYAPHLSPFTCANTCS